MQQPRIVSHAKQLLEAKGKRENRRISYRVMAAESGLSLSAVQDWVNDNVTQYKEATVIAICKYFDCQIGDLLTIESAEYETAQG